MIDVADKFNTLRYARAHGLLYAPSAIIARVENNNVPKGDVLQVARAAGITAAKRTSDWLVFCHPIPLDWVELSFTLQTDHIEVQAEIRSVWKTGVEMEAMTAVSAALLNMYDMLKPLTDDLVLGQIKLKEKSGGWSNFREKHPETIRAGVLVISDSTAAGERQDSSGTALLEFLKAQGFQTPVYEVLPDNVKKIQMKLVDLADANHADLLFTTGGTGVGPRDVTPEATRAVITMELPGISEAMRAYGRDRTPYAMHSRGVCGVRKHTIIVNLPGSAKGALQNIRALFPGLSHALHMIRGKGHD